MTPELKPGIALVLIGPKMSGKSVTARKLATEAGSWMEVDCHLRLDIDDFVRRVIREKPNTIIFDGWSKVRLFMQLLSKILVYNIFPGTKHREFKIPQLIFTLERWSFRYGKRFEVWDMVETGVNLYEPRIRTSKP